MQRTIRVLLEPASPQVSALVETSRLFARAFNTATRIGWAATITNSTKLHYAAYRPMRAACPGLVADLVNEARAKAAMALRMVRTNMSKGRSGRCPQTGEFYPPRFNYHTYRIDWISRTVVLALVGGRQTFRFRLPAYAEKYITKDVDTADLVQRGSRWWLHVVVTVPAPTVEPQPDVIGVDVGVAIPAVTSTGVFMGTRHWKEVKSRTFRLRRALQAAKSKSAKRHLRKTNGRTKRFRRDCDHVLSKRVVQATPVGGTIVVENLAGLRTNPKKARQFNRKIHEWSFAQLRAFVEYKAEERGCTVVAVDPRHTSQKCSRCGYTARNNRRSRGCFHCRKCGFMLHADLNAARNIAAKYHAGSGKPAPGGQPVNLPIVSETARPHAAEPSRDKPHKGC